jgi:hypothetical protein
MGQCIVHHMLASEREGQGLTHNIFGQVVASADRRGGLPWMDHPEESSLKSVALEEPWSTEKEQWRKAMTGAGVIDVAERQQLQIWRSMVHIPRYIACIDEKQRILKRMGQHLREFSSGSQARSLSIMLLLAGVVIDDTKPFTDKLQEWEDFYNFHRPHGGLD